MNERVRPGAMLRAVLLAAVLVATPPVARAQRAHTLDPGREAAFVGAGLLLNGTALLLPADTAGLWARHSVRDRATLPAFDRGAAFRWSPPAHNASNLLFGSALVLSVVGPVLAYADDGPGVPAAIVGESFLLSAGLTSVVKAVTHRPRPLVFNPDAPMHERRERDAFRSFWSGHAANTAALTVSAAMLVDRADVDPAMRTATWAGAVAVPVLMGWLRVRAGKHFPTDVLAGCLAGAVVGWAVPYFHRPENQP
ncbi:MAG: phosphatase PAP2 family protein [Flavobacteriales bacterium]|nr:phosphatase PAP2 family protein [Flavobacteriales bacterium]